MRPWKIDRTGHSHNDYNSHLEHILGHPHQRAYKKAHSTEFFLVKMIEDWRRAFGKNLMVGIAFVDFRKVYHSISHYVLLEKLQAVGIAGDLWCPGEVPMVLD